MQTVSLEFARRGEEDLQLFKEFNVPFALGLGVIDVKTHDVESAGLVADRIRRALDVMPGRAAGHQPRLRLRAPAARRRVQQAVRDGRGHAAWSGRSSAR